MKDMRVVPYKVMAMVRLFVMFGTKDVVHLNKFHRNRETFAGQ